VVATANFYRDKLGFLYDHFHGETPSFTIVHRSCAAIMLRSVGSPGFVRPNQVPDAPGDFAWDAYIWVENVDGLFEEFRRNGVTVARDICDQEYGCREFDILDPNGYRICFGEDLGEFPILNS
jgi:hypothetical protein